MERQIKFRARRVDNNEWVYSGITSPLHTPDGKTYIVTSNCIEDDEKLVFVEVHPESVGQSIGLKDKNGKEIYGGDFLRGSSDDKCLVIWRQDLASFALTKDGWAYDHYFGEAIDPGFCEITGTIHDGKEVKS